MPRNLSVAVFGAGAFGRNHLRVYRELEEAGAASVQAGKIGSGTVRLAAIVDADPAAQDLVRQQDRAPGQVPILASVEECLEARQAGRLELDAVSICLPTSAHYAAAARCLAEGVDVLLEKPISATLTEANALVRQAAETGRILQVGHVERFNPAVAAVAPLLDRPMFFEAHRLSIFTPRALDVDVVLDLMIHDLDVVLSFAQSPVLGVHAVGLPILSPKVDIANVRLEFASGAVANFTASRVSTERVRKLRFFQFHQYVSIDYARQDLLLVNVAQDGSPAAQNESPGPPSHPGLAFSKPTVEHGEPLRSEIEAFLHSVRTRMPPRVNAQAGRDALALALTINREIAAHADRAGLDRLKSGL